MRRGREDEKRNPRLVVERQTKIMQESTTYRTRGRSSGNKCASRDGSNSSDREFHDSVRECMGVEEMLIRVANRLRGS